MKRCRCCGRVHSRTGWHTLRFVGVQTDYEPDGTLAVALELRDCPCGSTLVRNLLKQ